MKTSCPTCRKKADWEGNLFRPFCSERCKLIDLGNWAAESYRIPSKPEEETGESPSGRSEEEEEPEGKEDDAPSAGQNGKRKTS